MFNLEQSIAEWRRKLSAEGIKSREVLDELESHLREDVEQQMRSGATAEQAFGQAVQRVGHADKLRGEFAKVKRSEPRLSRKLQLVGCVGIAVYVLLAETWRLFDSGITQAERLFGLAFVLAIAGYIALLPYLNWNFWRGVRGWEIRRALGKGGGCAVTLWCVWLLLSSANIVRLPSGVIFEVVCWGVVCAAMVTVLVLGFGFEAELLDLWTPATRLSLEAAEMEAFRFHHDFVGTEHVLLGLLESENSSVSRVLGKMGVSREAVRAEIEEIVAGGPQSRPTQTPTYTPRAKKALSIALREARALRRDRVDTEHISLGLLLEGSGVAALVLKALGVDPKSARDEILKEQGTS